MRTSYESGLQFQEVQEGSKTLHLIFQKSQAWSHMKHFGGSEEQCYFNSDKPTLQPAFTLDQALQMPELLQWCYQSSLGGSCGCRALFLYYWFSGDFREAAVTSAEVPKEFVKWFLFVAGTANPWTLPKVELHLLCGNDAKWNHCCKWFHSPGLSLFLKGWNGMLAIFLFIYFNLYFPSGAHLCPFSRKWADKEWLFGWWGRALCANPEEPLLSSREVFNIRTRCVCVSHPQSFWKQTQERWDSSHPWVLLLPSDTPYRAHLWVLHPNPSFLIGLKSFVFKRGPARQEIFAGDQIHDHSRDARCGTGVSPNLQLSRAGEDLRSLVTLHQEGHRAAGVLPLFCLGLVPFPLCSDWVFPPGKKTLLSQVALSVPPGEENSSVSGSSSHAMSLDRPSDSLWHLVSTAEEAFPFLRKTLLSYLYLQKEKEKPCMGEETTGSSPL